MTMPSSPNVVTDENPGYTTKYLRERTSRKVVARGVCSETCTNSSLSRRRSNERPHPRSLLVFVCARSSSGRSRVAAPTARRGTAVRPHSKWQAEPNFSLAHSAIQLAATPHGAHHILSCLAIFARPTYYMPLKFAVNMAGSILTPASTPQISRTLPKRRTTLSSASSTAVHRLPPPPRLFPAKGLHS